MPTNKKTVTYHYNKARIIALDNIEHTARMILRNNPNLKEFVMGNGTFFFLDKEDHPLPFTHTKISTFIYKWDSTFKLTGNPMRFTTKGKKITNW